jgi:hypothetical protein
MRKRQGIGEAGLRLLIDGALQVRPLDEGFLDLLPQNSEWPNTIDPGPIVTEPQDFCTEQGDRPYIVDLPAAIGDSTGPVQGGPIGDGSCMQLPQKMLDAQGKTLGLAGCGRLKRGAAVMDTRDIKRGTVIASGWDPKGYYPNYDPTGNHAAIFVKFVPGGFRVLEQVHGSVQIVDKTNTRGGYYSNPNAYNIVLSGSCVPGVPRKQRYPG